MNHELALELADWLGMIRSGHEESIARNDPFIRKHIAKLVLWEKMIRDIVFDELVAARKD